MTLTSSPPSTYAYAAPKGAEAGWDAATVIAAERAAASAVRGSPRGWP